MKNKDLIEELKKFDPDTEVLISDCVLGCCPPNLVTTTIIETRAEADLEFLSPTPFNQDRGLEFKDYIVLY